MTQIEADESGWQRWGVRLLPALTFLLGLALAGLVMAARGPGGVGAAQGEEASPSPSASSAGASPSDTVVTVPGACEEAAARITEATRLIDDVVVAVRDFQPQELVELLNELEDLDAETRPLAEQCSAVDVSASASPSGEASPSETTSPSQEPAPSPSPSQEPTSSQEPEPSE